MSKNLLEALAAAEKAMNLHLNKDGDPLFLYRIKKLIRHPYRFTRLVCFKTGILPDPVVRARTFFGASISVPLSDVNAADLFYAGCLRASEGYVTRFLIKHLEKGDVFYDVGANYGFYSALALSLGSEVHAFEPSPHCLMHLRKSVLTSSMAKNMKISPVALSDMNGSVEFFDTSEGHKSGMSTIEARVAESNKMAYQKRMVDTTTLDTYVQENSVPTIIKIDTEGSEAKVLAGAHRLLLEHSPIIVMEIWENRQGIENSRTVLNLLQQAGYASHAIARDGSLYPFEIRFGEVGENNNFVFKKI